MHYPLHTSPTIDLAANYNSRSDGRNPNKFLTSLLLLLCRRPDVPSLLSVKVDKGLQFILTEIRIMELRADFTLK